MIYPWQQEQWEQLQRSRQEKRLPHALIFAGIAGTGKAKFADEFSRLMLCQQVTADNKPCHVCHMCRLIEGRAHPNVLWVEPEKAGQAIKVDQIREVTEFVNHTALQGDHRIVIISPANNMNASAANALLKTLEEPTPGVILILISNQSERLPATILSRCQRIHFPQPRHDLALSWLQEQLQDNAHDSALLLRLAHGAPLAALQLVEQEILATRTELFTCLATLSLRQSDPVKSAAKLQDAELLQVLDLTLSWLMDLQRLQLDVDVTDVVNKDHSNALVEMKARIPFRQSARFMQYLLTLRGQISQGLNLNKQLVLESMLIRWMECAG